MIKKPSAPAPRLHSQQAPKEKKIELIVELWAFGIRLERLMRVEYPKDIYLPHNMSKGLNYFDAEPLYAAAEPTYKQAVFSYSGRQVDRHGEIRLVYEFKELV